jgi:hypothetical protein
MSTDPIIKELVERAEHMPSQGENWPAFIDALRESDYDVTGPIYQGGPGSLTRSISIALGPKKDEKVSLTRLFQEWDDYYKRDQAKRVRQRYLDSTVEVIYLDKNGRLKKPERIPKEDAHTPWKPGCHIQEEGAHVEGRGWDNDQGATFVLKTTPIGTETPTGTIVGKRKLSGTVQYLIKPRSGPAEKKYLARLELESLQTQLRINLDYMSPEDIQKTHERIEVLKHKV